MQTKAEIRDTASEVDFNQTRRRYNNNNNYYYKNYNNQQYNTYRNDNVDNGTDVQHENADVETYAANQKRNRHRRPVNNMHRDNNNTNNKNISRSSSITNKVDSNGDEKPMSSRTHVDQGTSNTKINLSLTSFGFELFCLCVRSVWPITSSSCLT